MTKIYRHDVVLNPFISIDEFTDNHTTTKALITTTTTIITKRVVPK